MNIFVAGRSGFIGTNLIKQLEKNREKDDIITSIDICDTPFVDARKVNHVARFVANADITYHLANIPAHRLSMGNPYKVIENNYASTLSIAEACRRMDCKKLVFFSSFAVYGDYIPPWNEETPVKATTPYGLCKIQSEMLLYSYYLWYGLDIIVIRPSNVFGPHEELHHPLQVIPQWFDDAKNDRPLIVFGVGTNRDFTFVGDIVDGAIKASKKNGYRVYNLCSGRPIFLKDIAYEISSNVIIKLLPSFETMVWYGSYEKAHKELGYSPTKNVMEWIHERKQQIFGKKADA